MRNFSLFPFGRKCLADLRGKKQFANGSSHNVCVELGIEAQPGESLDGT